MTDKQPLCRVCRILVTRNYLLVTRNYLLETTYIELMDKSIIIFSRIWTKIELLPSGFKTSRIL